MGFHLQVPRGGTHPNELVGSELTFLFCSDLFFVTVGFVYSRWRFHCNRRLCRQMHLTRDFFSTHSSLCAHHIVAQGVAAPCLHKNNVHPHVITCLSVCCSFVLSSSSVSRASTFFFHFYLFSVLNFNLHVVETARALNPLRTRRNEEYCPVAIHNPLQVPPMRDEEPPTLPASSGQLRTVHHVEVVAMGDDDTDTLVSEDSRRGVGRVPTRIRK